MGVEADLINYGVGLAVDKGYDPFLLVHDQCLAEIKKGQSAAEFGSLLATLPPWAAGLPLRAEAKTCRFYAK
jgi:DNA polymerase